MIRLLRRYACPFETNPFIHSSSYRAHLVTRCTCKRMDAWLALVVFVPQQKLDNFCRTIYVCLVLWTLWPSVVTGQKELMTTSLDIARASLTDACLAARGL
jgi:hypothetical protein